MSAQKSNYIPDSIEEMRDKIADESAALSWKALSFTALGAVAGAAAGYALGNAGAISIEPGDGRITAFRNADMAVQGAFMGGVGGVMAGGMLGALVTAKENETLRINRAILARELTRIDGGISAEFSRTHAKSWGEEYAARLPSSTVTVAPGPEGLRGGSMAAGYGIG